MRCPGAGLRASMDQKGDFAFMKKLFRNIAEYFGRYGERMSQWNLV